jgi:undecaprenyl-diphosphatase
MTEYLHAAILGIVQGVAEFLPVSSSGHLVIVGELLDQYGGTEIPAESATMSIALHFGTLLSILFVYRRELPGIVKDIKLLKLILLATIPVGAIGILLKDQIEEVFDTPLLAGGGLIVTAVLLLIGRRLQRRQQHPAELNSLTAGMIGVFQAIAIIPGISRSGSTIAAGLACGLTREQAARFSFLIAIPAISGAAIVKAKDLVTRAAAVDSNLLPVALGTFIAFVVGIAALSWLLTIVTADRLHWFAGYCLLAGSATIMWQLSTTSSAADVTVTQVQTVQSVAASQAGSTAELNGSCSDWISAN